MEDYAKYYEERLYPFQLGILNIVKELKLPFYLTGGTALSRYYFNHRYSDDLDLFVNNDELFNYYISTIFEVFEKKQRSDFSVIYDKTYKSENYCRIFLKKDDAELKIDFINDVSSHDGDFEHSEKLGLVDSWLNILTNKVAALFRYEIKDIVDLWVISKNKSFHWNDIISLAKKKEIGIDPLLMSDIISSVPVEYLGYIKWCKYPNFDQIKEDIHKISIDILENNDNSLHNIQVE